MVEILTLFAEFKDATLLLSVLIILILTTLLVWAIRSVVKLARCVITALQEQAGTNAKFTAVVEELIRRNPNGF